MHLSGATLIILTVSLRCDWFLLISFDHPTSLTSSCPYTTHASSFQVVSTQWQYESIASIATIFPSICQGVATEKSSDAFQLHPHGAIYPSIYLSIRLSITCDRCDHIAVHTVQMIHDARLCDFRSSFAVPYSQLGSTLARSSSILTRQTKCKRRALSLWQMLKMHSPSERVDYFAPTYVTLELPLERGRPGAQ